MLCERNSVSTTSRHTFLLTTPQPQQLHKCTVRVAGSACCSCNPSNFPHHIPKLACRTDSNRPLNNHPPPCQSTTTRFDARSEFSSALSSQASDQAAKLEELSLMIRDLAPAPPHKAPWIPEPALAFGTPGMRFVPVPAFTGGWQSTEMCVMSNARLVG